MKNDRIGYTLVAISIISTMVCILILVFSYRKPPDSGSDSQEMNRHTITMSVGQDQKPDPDISSGKKELTWETEDPDVAIVSEDGVITATNAGSTTVTCRDADGKIIASYDLKVEQDPNTADSVDSSERSGADSGKNQSPGSAESKKDSRSDKNSKNSATGKNSGNQKKSEDAYDDTAPTIIVHNTNGKPGDKGLKVAVNVANNPGILGMTLTLEYDDSIMELTGASNGEALSERLTMTPSKTMGNGSRFTWDGESLTPADVRDGEILVLTFDISADAKSGEYPVKVSYEDGDIVNASLIPVDIYIKNGNVVIR